ncbi:MAG: hypothetical protein ACRD0Z_17040 [Acidimicrobiales bacterium]
MIALALPLGTVAFGSAAASAANRQSAVSPHAAVKFTGSVTCALKGSLSIKQTADTTLGLEYSTPETAKIKLTATATACTGDVTQGGVTLTKGAISASITGSYDWESFIGAPPDAAGKITWKGTGGTITATTFSLGSGTVSLGPPANITYPSTTQKGSFAGSGKASANVKQSASSLIKSCETSPYLKTITIGSGSTIS